MDGELDRGMRIRLHSYHFATTRPPFDQQLKVNRTPLISAKAVIERVVEPLQAHVLPTSRIAAIQERTMISTGVLGIAIHRKPRQISQGYR
jgi:hypothetical protein